VRIFYAVDPSPNHWALGDSLVWHRNLYETLAASGHDLVPFAFDFREYNRHLDLEVPEQRAYVERHRPALEAALLGQVEAAHRERPLDLFFSYFYAAHCSPAVVREVRALGVPTVNFFCNGSYQFHLVRDLAPAYDWSLVPERFRLEDYRRAGAHPYYFQEAANPRFYRPREVARRYDVTFVGQMYGDRPFFVDRLHRADVRVRVWGPGWLEAYPSGGRLWKGRLRRLLAGKWRRDREAASPSDNGAPKATAPARAWTYPRLPARILGPPLSDDAMVSLYSESHISLGFAKVGETFAGEAPIRQVRLRDFEAPMSGAFYLMEHVAEIEEFFRVGEEVVCYEGADDLVDKALYYLTHEAEREKIRQAGHRRALADHTWDRRFAAFFAHAGLPASGSHG
jgi:spore maturation protein CgeB